MISWLNQTLFCNSKCQCDNRRALFLFAIIKKCNQSQLILLLTNISGYTNRKRQFQKKKKKVVLNMRHLNPNLSNYKWTYRSQSWIKNWRWVTVCICMHLCAYLCVSTWACLFAPTWTTSSLTMDRAPGPKFSLCFILST